MDNRFKDALRMLRSAQNPSPAFDVAWSYKPLNKGSAPIMEPVVPNPSDQTQKAEEISKKNEITEKTKILDSLYQFGDEKLAKKEEFEFPGGSLAKKDRGARTLVPDQELAAASKNELLESMTVPAAKLKIEEKLNELNGCKVLFITDSISGEGDPQNLFECFFKSHVAELFERMVNAMKLSDAWMLTDLGDKTIQALVKEILFYQPEVIMTLGAGPTQFLLGTESRLKNIHGQFFQVQQGEYLAKLMPLFSPKLLSTAPNMKKTAWADMQKVMTELKLL